MPACLRISVKVTLTGGSGFLAGAFWPAEPAVWSKKARVAASRRSARLVPPARAWRERGRLIACDRPAKARSGEIAGARREAMARRSQASFLARWPEPARYD